MNTFKVSDSQRALIVVIEGETIKLKHGPTAKTSDFGADLSEVRKLLKETASAAFIVLRVGEGKDYALVMFVPEDTKPKVKLMFASSALQFRNATHLGLAGETHLETVDGLTPALFGHKTEEDRQEMMSEKEKIQQEMSKLEVAQTTGAMPGLHSNFGESLSAAVKDFNDEKILGFTAALDGAKVNLDATFPSDASLEAIAKGLPTDRPRYALLRAEEKSVLVYCCPSGSKIRERTPYAATLPDFVSQLKEMGVKVAARIEIDDTAEMEATIKERLAPVTEEEKTEAKPAAPAKVVGKGPRMLI